MYEGKDVTSETEPAWWHRPLRNVGIAAVVAVAIWAALWLIFRGSAAAVATVVSSSLAAKIGIGGLVAVGVVAYVNEFRPGGRTRYDTLRSGTGVILFGGGTLVVVAFIVAGVAGGFISGTALAVSHDTVDGDLPAYAWRTPFDVAAAAVDQRAEVDGGNFAKGDTTFLPADNTYSTPVTGRGFASGFTKVVIQTEGDTRTKVCEFDGAAPRPGGFMSKNLRRQLALIDGGLVVNEGDIWGYCDGDDARLVVPVTRMTAGMGQGHPVPAGVVIFDGADGELDADVEPGEYPGPVYPMSLAAAQRTALASTGSFFDKVFNRAGFETSDDSYDTTQSGDEEGTSAKLNNSELLLADADGNGYDFVTPLTPRSNSERIVAVSTIAADRVVAGELNEFVVHKLGEQSQRGNSDLVEVIRANFPGLGWETGIAVAEIIPTDNGVLEASLRNGGVVAKRVRITGEQLCLLTADGEKIDCTSTDSSDVPDAAAGDDAGAVETRKGSDAPATDNGDLSELSTNELLDLIDGATEELRDRDS